MEQKNLIQRVQKKRKDALFVLQVAQILALLAVYFFPVDAYAVDFQDIIKKTAKILKYIALVLGPGLGLIFALQGLMKIRQKDDDPKAFGKGLTFIVVGVACAIVGVIVGSIMEYYGVGNSSEMETSEPTER